MDFDLSDDQQAILEAVDTLLDQHAGVARATLLGATAAYDTDLDAALRKSGFLEIASGEDTGALEAALLVERVAAAGGIVAVAAEALVAPGLGIDAPAGPVALASAATPGPVRYAAHARTLLVEDGDEARCVSLRAGVCEAVPSNFGLPVGRVPAEILAGGESLGAGSGARLRRWWRLALAAETIGCMGAALQVTVDYLKERRQFGRAIGSFQAVQHRLADCAIAIEGSRWLVYEAAAHGAPDEAVATAAAYALDAAGQVFGETHQLSGAIGFTREHDLHVFSMRLHGLRAELGGLSGHRRALAAARWGVPA